MLEIRDLHVSYGTDVILNGLDLFLPPGGTLAVIGESGTGKTTLGRAVMGLAEATVSGSITFDGRELTTLTEDDWQPLRWERIAMVFQNINNVLNPLHTVIDQVIEPVTAHRRDGRDGARNRAASLLVHFGLPEARFTAYPHQLSGGEQQRVLLAMAFSNEPDLVILDEPLSSLDVTSRSELCDVLAESACARLVITHDLDTASRLADNIAVLYGGRFVETGPAAEVLAEPRHPYTRALIRAYPNLTTVKDLQGIKGRMTRPVAGCPFHPRCTQARESCAASVPELAGDGRKVACHRGGIVTLLSLRDIAVSYDGFKAVDGVSLDVRAGETVSLVGQSGSGKTTLARAIVGLQEADTGTVLLEGKKVTHRDKTFHRRVQMVFQNPGESLSHRLSVVQLVMEPLDVQKIGTKEERYEKAVRTIAEVELPTSRDFLETYPHHLSGGELQRVSIARALIMDPELLIADEPTAFLDASVGAKILKLLLNLQENRGLSLLYITHDLAAARKVSDRIAVMEKGCIAETGPAEVVTVSPASASTRALLDAAARLRPAG